MNKSKSYRKVRSNVALLSGLLICGSCHSLMRPKVSGRLNAKGEPIYTYLCSMKERSRGHVCKMRNCSGNLMDADIVNQLKSLSENGSDFLRQLEQSKRVLAASRQSYDEEISRIEADIAANDDAIKVSALGKASETSAEGYIIRQINELHDKGEGFQRRLDQLKELTADHVLADMEFDLLAQMSASFKDTVDGMTVEQKRAAIRTFLKQVIWDGSRAHLVLFGSDYEYEYEFPEILFSTEDMAAEDGESANFETAAEKGNVEPP